VPGHKPAALLLDLGRQLECKPRASVCYDAGFPRRRRAVRHQETAGAHGTGCGVGWGGGMERERAPHRMFCFGGTHVRRRATGAAANAYASRLGYLNSSSTHGATADGPGAGQQHCPSAMRRRRFLDSDVRVRQMRTAPVHLKSSARLFQWNNNVFFSYNKSVSAVFSAN